jgi:hypothetical protein
MRSSPTVKSTLGSEARPRTSSPSRIAARPSGWPRGRDIQLTDKTIRPKLPAQRP